MMTPTSCAPRSADLSFNRFGCGQDSIALASRLLMRHDSTTVAQGLIGYRDRQPEHPDERHDEGDGGNNGRGHEQIATR